MASDFYSGQNSEALNCEIEALMSENSKSWRGLTKRLHLSWNDNRRHRYRLKQSQRKFQNARMSVSARLFNHDKMGQDNLEDTVQSRLESLALINEDEMCKFFVLCWVLCIFPLFFKIFFLGLLEIFNISLPVMHFGPRKEHCSFFNLYVFLNKFFCYLHELCLL